MLPGKMGSAIKLKLFSGIHLLLKVFPFQVFVNHIAGKSFMNKSTSRCDFWQEIFLIASYQQLTATFILLSILLIFDIIWTIKHSFRVQE